ncbi:hypothetical protein FNO01nite_26200 [Flavobacterium noncentrifugens]|uniref:Por secretion system C-terminal sorting domain-containing protein n=1 Tax=Flavobacterium noncentrifugens TaxID=1128970 RepID=A0A1G8ZHI2_9FLAO|nr:T9SS type A sorting domain-containing protein [Flavobacterium noncentrifugens]GEP51948.1 hypothetical protein FNO01nite_26200 [Flavobacterium noncentrifugens]SDK14054.1 Por secretion system C-terminal sorting domain-containing protein [Flavobacterium noncentrifugens]
MKKFLLTALAALPAFLTATAQIVNIPDPVLKNFLVHHSYHNNPGGSGWNVPLDTNSDGEIQYSEAVNYPADGNAHMFSLQGLGIHDLTGIEAFQAIQWINAPDNPITNLDVTGCLSLKRLTLSYNNAFTDLTLVNASLEKIELSCPTLTSLDLNGCPALKEINVTNNPLLTTLTVTNCSAVQQFLVYLNPVMTTLNMGSHYYMTLFQCQNNNLSSLDISACRSLQYFFCTGNPLTSLNMANGNPQSFVTINASGFPGLSCIKVNNPAVSQYLWLQTGGNYQFDEGVEFRTDCTPPGPCIVAIPDAHFKAKLLQNAAINTNGNTEIECSEAEAYTGAINVDNSEIADMTGIKAFSNITSLSCNGNDFFNFTSLDVSGLGALTTVSCTGNWFFNNLNVSNCTALTTFSVNTATGGTDQVINASGCTSLTGFTTGAWTTLSLDLSGCTALTALDMANKYVSALNITNCSALATLDISHNQLTQLSFTGCNALTAINCSYNSITSLAVANVSPLTNLDCSFNQLSTLNVMDNTNLAVLNCSNNRLPYLLVSNNTALTQLDCSTNSIGYLDVNNNPVLRTLNCSHNNLNALNVNSNTALGSLNCSYNNISSQNVSFNTALFLLDCSYNRISTQDVSLNTALTMFYCSHNTLTTVDLRHNSILRSLDCSFNQLSELHLDGCPVLIQLDCSTNRLAALDLSALAQLTWLVCNNNLLTALDVSRTNCIILTCDDNQLTSLNLANGNNTNWMPPTAHHNPGLECVKVDNAVYCTGNWSGDNFGFDAGVSFSENCALGMTEIIHNLFVAYPNPTTGLVHFSKPVNMVLYTITGQKIADKQHTDSFDLSGQPNGVYLMAISDDSGNTLTRKIIKI